MRSPIYLNACSHGLPDRATLDRMVRHLQREVEIGPMAALTECRDDFEGVRAQAATVLGAAPAQVGFGTGTAALWTRIVGRSLRPKVRVLVSSYEWGDHLRFLSAAAVSTGTQIDAIPAAEAMDPAAWADRIDADVTTICLPMVTSIEGRVTPVAQISRLPRPDGTLLVVDAAQALGRVALGDLGATADAVVATTRKWLRAPRQTAIFSVSDRAQRCLDLTVADLEGTDANVALRLGLATALETFHGLGLDVVRQGIGRFDQALRAGLSARRPDLQVLPSHTLGTVTLVPTADQREALDRRLTEAGLLPKWCSPSRDEPWAPAFAVDQVLRISPHLSNKAPEIDACLDAIGTT